MPFMEPCLAGLDLLNQNTSHPQSLVAEPGRKSKRSLSAHGTSRAHDLAARCTNAVGGSQADKQYSICYNKVPPCPKGGRGGVKGERMRANRSREDTLNCLFQCTPTRCKVTSKLIFWLIFRDKQGTKHIPSRSLTRFVHIAGPFLRLACRNAQPCAWLATDKNV